MNQDLQQKEAVKDSSLVESGIFCKESFKVAATETQKSSLPAQISATSYDLSAASRGMAESRQTGKISIVFG